MIILIPTNPALYAYTEEIILDKVSYVLWLQWSSRFNYWALNVLDSEQNFLVVGIKLVFGINLFEQYPDKGLPAGGLFLSGGDYDTAPAFGELGSVIELIYVPEDDLAAIR